MIRIYNPTAASADEQLDIQLKRQPLRGLRLGVIDNSKPNFDHLAHDLAKLLADEFDVELVEFHHKHSAADGAGDETYTRIARNCDLVLAGSGD